MKDEPGKTNRENETPRNCHSPHQAGIPRGEFRFHPSSFLLHPSSFIFAQAVLVLAALCFTPLVHTSRTYEQYVMPKMAWVGMVAVLLVLLSLAKALFGVQVRIALHGVNLLVAAFFAWNLLMWPLAKSPSLAGDRVKWLGLVLLAAWAWQEWASARRRRILAALWGLAIAAGITAAWTLWQDLAMKCPNLFPAWLRPLPALNRLGDWRGFLTAGFGNTDFIAMFLAMLYLPILLFLAHVRGKWRAGLILAILWLSAAAMIVCWSVGNNAALILGFLILAAGMGKERRKALWRRKRRFLAWLAGCALAVAWLVANTPLNPHRPTGGAASSGLPGIFAEAFGSQRWKEGGPTRGVIWINTLEMIRRNQLKGVGPGCFVYEYPGMRSPLVPNDPAWLRYQGTYTNAAHNTLMQVWAELGPVGALLLIAMVVAAFRALARRAREASRALARQAISIRPIRPIRPSGLAAPPKPLNGWIAWGGISALAVLCGASIMSFPLQLPATTLLFFALLPLGEMIGDPTRSESGFHMPPVTLEGRWTETVLHLRGMKRIVAVGACFRIPRAAAVGALLPPVVLCGFWMAQVWKPVVADAWYNQARNLDPLLPYSAQEEHYRLGIALNPSRAADIQKQFEQFKQQTRPDFRRNAGKSEADALYRRALALWPRHHDCRSRYSEFLLQTGRYQECVDQMEILLKRLNSTELYLRRASALRALGRNPEALRDLAAYIKRLPQFKSPPSAAGS